MEKASGAAEKVESQVKQLSKQIDEIRNNAIGGMDDKLKELNKKINKAQADKTKLGVAISANERFVHFTFLKTILICSQKRNMEKSRSKIESLEEEIVAMKGELLKMKDKKDSIAAESKELMVQKNDIGVSCYFFISVLTSDSKLVLVGKRDCSARAVRKIEKGAEQKAH